MSLRAIKYVTASETLDPTYDTFFLDASSGNITFTLNDITNDGEIYWIKRTDTSSNTVIVQGYNSSQTIEGQTSVPLNSGDRAAIISTLTNIWYYF
jgi:hypothetical protein